jgi:hypothetical protein
MTAPTTRPTWATLKITAERLKEKGLSDIAIRMLAPDGDILWHNLARQDGMLALACLEDDMLAGITAQLRADGAPPAMVNTPAGVAHMLIIAAEAYCPEEPSWQDNALRSAVATALLLRLAESAWREKQIVITSQMPLALQ